MSEGYARGGDGMTDLADKVVVGRGVQSSPRRGEAALSIADLPLEAKIAQIATKVYGAERVSFKPCGPRAAPAVRGARLRQRCPVCIAKTQYSFTDDPKQMGAPSGWTLNVTDATLSAGAGFVVAIAGSMMLMPGLGKTPQAHKLDVDDGGQRRRAWTIERPAIVDVDSCRASIVKTIRTRECGRHGGS